MRWKRLQDAKDASNVRPQAAAGKLSPRCQRSRGQGETRDVH